MRIFAGPVIVVGALLAWFLTEVVLPAIPGYTWHPLNGNGYQFWSGIGSDVAELSILTALVAAAVGFWRHHDCHVHRCWRLSWHPHPVHGHPVCRVHHPDHKQVSA